MHFRECITKKLQLAGRYHLKWSGHSLLDSMWTPNQLITPTVVKFVYSNLTSIIVRDTIFYCIGSDCGQNLLLSSVIATQHLSKADGSNIERSFDSHFKYSDRPRFRHVLFMVMHEFMNVFALFLGGGQSLGATRRMVVCGKWVVDLFIRANGFASRCH